MNMIVLLWVIACAGTASNGQQACPDIEDSKQRDACYHEEILLMPASDITKIVQTAQQITDPMIRGAAVSEWVKNHNNDINQQQGQQLCTLLDGRDRSYCLRRLSSPHLQR